jgi:hypothetical protein
MGSTSGRVYSRVRSFRSKARASPAWSTRGSAREAAPRSDCLRDALPGCELWVAAGVGLVLRPELHVICAMSRGDVVSATVFSGLCCCCANCPVAGTGRARVYGGSSSV